MNWNLVHVTYDEGVLRERGWLTVNDDSIQYDCATHYDRISHFSLAKVVLNVLKFWQESRHSWGMVWFLFLLKSLIWYNKFNWQWLFCTWMSSFCNLKFMLSYKQLRNKTSNTMSCLRILECPNIQIYQKTNCFIDIKVPLILISSIIRHTSFLQLLLVEIKQNMFYFIHVLHRKSTRKITLLF